jgi:hypothetical protein
MPPSLPFSPAFFTKQTANRVYWLVLTLLIAFLIGFIGEKLGDENLHTLVGHLAVTGNNPFDQIQAWRTQQPYQWWLALLEVSIDTLLFIPAYYTTLTIWCRYFAHHSLFVTNPFRQRQAYWIKRLGLMAAAGLLIGVGADLLESLIMLGWLFGLKPTAALSRWPMALIELIKFAPVGLATWYVLLHPLGLLFSAREALYRLLRIEGGEQEAARLSLLDYIIEHHRREERINAAIGAQRTQHPHALLRMPIRERLRTAWRGFLNVQFVVYIVLALAVLLTQLDQFDELFYFLMTEGRGFVVLLCTLAGLGLLGGMLYVCSRILLFIQPTFLETIDHTPFITDDDISRTTAIIEYNRPMLTLLRNVPLWLGHAPFVLMALTLMLNFSRLRPQDQQNPAFVFKYICVLMLLAGTYLLFTMLLRRIDATKRPDERNDETNIALFKSTRPSRDYALLVDLAPRSILFGQGLLVALLMLFLPTATGLGLSEQIGLYAVVLLWLAALAYLGTLVYQFNNLPNYPVLLGLVLAALAFSYVNDNSAIRKSPEAYTPTGETKPSPAMLRPGIDAYYTRWLENRTVLDTTSATDSLPLPVVIVATAGGGIRAAAWTTEALMALNQRIPGFDQHLFAISGVSGGGVGAATYVATLAGQSDTIRREYTLIGPDSALTERVRATITKDLISPTAASMLFRGGVHNFIPLPVAALDRNRWLEDAWEQSLLRKENLPTEAVRASLSRSFLSLWPTTETLKTALLDRPALLLNGAVAETGQKVLMTNLNLDSTALGTNPFFDAVDLFASTRHDVPFKTATFLCARFPFVTSGGRATGTLPNIQTEYRQTDYHIIDGGYGENTGIITAVQLIKQLQRVSSKLKLRRRIEYYLLFLPNYATADAPGSVQTFRFLAEPVKGFLRTWDRDGVTLNQLIGTTLQGSQNELSFRYVGLALNPDKHRYPLGWYISPTAVETMGRQAQQDVQAKLNDPAGVLRQISLQVRAFGLTQRMQR